MTSLWFAGKEMALAIGVTITFSRLGSSFNSLITPKIYAWSGDYLVVPLWFGVLITLFSFLCGQVACWMDKKSDEAENVEKTTVEDEAEKINLKDVSKFTLSYWILCLQCLVVYNCYFTWTDIINAFYVAKYNFTISTAGNLVSIPYFQAAVITPMFGTLIDRLGKRGFFMILSSLLAIGVHFFWFALPGCERCWLSVVPLIIFGIFYSCYASVIWPSIPLVVEKNLIGTAFGLVTAVQNTGLFLIPLVAGALVTGANEDKIKGYGRVSLMLIALGLVGLILSIWSQIREHDVLDGIAPKDTSYVIEIGTPILPRRTTADIDKAIRSPFNSRRVSANYHRY